MTATIVDLKCPACGHVLGQEEHERVVANFHRIAEEQSTGVIEQMRYECDKKLEDLQDQHKRNLDNEINQRVASQTNEIHVKYNEDKKGWERRHNEELLLKDKEIKEAKLQNTIDIEEKIKQAINVNEQQLEAKYKQKEAEGELQLRRIKDDNQNLLKQVEKLQKTVDSVPPELRGTAGEIVLLDTLHDAFPDDELVPKIAGVQMADVIQTIVKENREKIAPPIVWDRKLVNTITGAHICQAKGYKTTHDTDYSIIVTEKGITKKDSDNSLIGSREGIWLIHPTMVVEIAKIFRNFIMESAKQTISNKDRASKQAKLYNYLKSPEFARAMQATRNASSKLDDLQREEEKDHKRTWYNRKKLIDEWRTICEYNQQKINDIMQDTTNEDSQDEDKEEEDYSSSKHNM
jgi:hypothetical protein